MKIEIEKPVIWNNDDEIARAFICIVNAICCSNTETQLREALQLLEQENNISVYYAWGFGSHHLWIAQRCAPNAVELYDRVLISRF